MIPLNTATITHFIVLAWSHHAPENACLVTIRFVFSVLSSVSSFASSVFFNSSVEYELSIFWPGRFVPYYRLSTKEWRKQQANRFLRCQPADFGPQWSVNKLYNKKKMDKLVLFATPCSWPCSLPLHWFPSFLPLYSLLDAKQLRYSLFPLLTTYTTTKSSSSSSSSSYK